MKRSLVKFRHGACNLLAGALLAAAAAPAFGGDYTPVTDARLANPEPQNWLMTRRLPALGLTIADCAVAVASGFTGRVGGTQS